MKFDSNFYTGIVSLIIFSICGVLSVNGSVLIVILSVFLFLIASAAATAIYSVVLPEKFKIKTDWSIFAPFAAMLILSRIFLGWDIFAAFITAGFLSLSVGCIKENKLNIKQSVAVLSLGGISAFVFVLVSIAGGTLV